MNRKICRIRREKGFILIATALALVAIMGIAGISVDVGRMYIVKSELLVYTDAASISAALQLDGTPTGIVRAQNAAAGMGTGANAMAYDFATKPITGAAVQFAKGLAATPNAPDPATWDANPANPTDYRFVQVLASAGVPLIFMKVFLAMQSGTNTSISTVNASSVAAQVLVT